MEKKKRNKEKKTGNTCARKRGSATRTTLGSHYKTRFTGHRRRRHRIHTARYVIRAVASRVDNRRGEKGGKNCGKQPTRWQTGNAADTKIPPAKATRSFPSGTLWRRGSWNRIGRRVWRDGHTTDGYRGISYVPNDGYELPGPEWPFTMRW